MGQGQFANQRALIEYAEAHDLAYVWEGSFAKRWRLAQLARPGQYELVEVPTKRGLSKVPFPRAILRAEYEAERPSATRWHSSASDCGPREWPSSVQSKQTA